MKPSEQSARQIFEAVLSLTDSDERRALIESLCAGNDELRREVESLLQAHEQAGDFMGRTAPLPAPDFVIERTGTMIGRYKLLEKIGEGGFGVVYMAEQLEPVQRKVALKIIKAGMDTREVIARFEAERQALALMDHPNIAKVLDAGATEAGRPYFVMELVRGIPITDYCDQKNLPTGKRLQLFMKVCHAVQHAHQKGIIHRDIKPTNVLVTLHDGEPVPKVIDFGVAKALGQKLTEKTLFTAFQQMIGTPAYMSPEQAELSGLDVDTRSDIYSLGVLLYELLTGVTPFDGETLRKVAMDEMRRMIRETEPQKPSTRLQTLGDTLTSVARHRQTEPATLRRLVRGDLDWIVMKALEKERTRRYESANGLAEDIERHLNIEPILACPPSSLYRFQKVAHRNKLAFAAAGAVLAALILGLGASAWMFVKERKAYRVAVAAEAKAREEATKSHQVAQLLKDMLEGIGPSVALGRDTKMLREIADQTARRLDHDLKDQPAVEAALRTTLGNVYRDLGEYTNAASMHRRSFELRKELFGLEHPDSASSLNELGELLRRQGRHSEAEPRIREALAIRKRLFGNEHLDVAQSLDSLAMLVFYDTGGAARINEAIKLAREALAMRQKLLGGEHLEVANSLEHLGIILNPTGRYGEAEATHREALRLRINLFGDEHPDIATSLHQVAWSLYLQKKPADSEAMFRKALTMRRRVLGSTNPDLANTLLNLGNVLHQQEKYGEAAEVLREVLDIQRQVFGEGHPAMVSPLTSLAGIQHRQGKLPEAEALFRQALAIDTEGYGQWHPSSAALLERFARVLREQGKPVEETIGEVLAARKLSGNQPAPRRPAVAVLPRPENATPAMIDLSRHFHAALTETWHGLKGNDLARLPSGIQAFGGVRFDVRGVVQLNGAGIAGTIGESYPQRVQGIKIGRKCARFHFLHSTGWAVPDGTVIGSYVLRYADESSRVLPLVYGQDVRDWWMREALEIKNGQIAWHGHTSRGDPVRIYIRTWENPSPDLEVASIEFISAMTESIGEADDDAVHLVALNGFQISEKELCIICTEGQDRRRRVHHQIFDQLHLRDVYGHNAKRFLLFVRYMRLVADVRSNQVHHFFCLSPVATLAEGFRINRVPHVMQSPPDAADVCGRVEFQTAFACFIAVEPIVRETDEVGRLAAIMGHQHFVVELAGKFVEQTLADGGIGGVIVAVGVREAGEEVRWWKLLLVADNNDLGSERHGEQAVENSNLGSFVENDQVERRSGAVENGEVNQIGERCGTHHPARLEFSEEVPERELRAVVHHRTDGGKPLQSQQPPKLAECGAVFHLRLLHPRVQLAFEVIHGPLGQAFILLDERFQSLAELRAIRLRDWIAKLQKVEAEEPLGVLRLHRGVCDFLPQRHKLWIRPANLFLPLLLFEPELIAREFGLNFSEKGDERIVVGQIAGHGFKVVVQPLTKLKPCSALASTCTQCVVATRSSATK